MEHRYVYIYYNNNREIMEFNNLDLTKTFIGTVEDNQDPNKLGRCRIRVLNVFDNIPTEDIPWSTPFNDLNGNQFFLPELGKIVSVYFEDGNLYTPIYKYALHYNKNLEQKLSELDDDTYLTMRSLMFDNKTQIFSNDKDSLMIDYKFNQINIKEDNIDINLKDNNGVLNLGTDSATQEAILGTNFLEWMDEFIDNLLGTMGGPYMGNLTAPVVPNPAFVKVLNKYKLLKDPKFLSKNVMIVDNKYVNTVKRGEIDQTGDEWTSTIEENEITTIDNIKYAGTNSEPEWTPDGQLTENGDGTPTAVLSEEELDQQEVPKSVNKDIDALIEVLKSKGYKLYIRPYEMNLIGIRYQYPGQEYSNKFKDKMYLIWKDNDDNWVGKYWKISTIPGRNTSWKNKKLLKDTKGPGARNGLGILKPAQYVNVYQMGYYKTEIDRASRAMRTVGKQLAYRDRNYGDSKITFSVEDPANANGGKNFAMHIHKAYTLKNGSGSAVNNWSEGCQVFPNKTSLNDFFDKCEVHKSKYGNSFTYTLITSNDFDKAIQKIELENRKSELL